MLPGERIAVVELVGVIGGAIRASEYERVFSNLRRSSGVKAVILDIDSPGGSPTECEYLHMQLAKLTGSKPVIAFIRGSCLSGAYIVACSGTSMVAVPGSLVGAIGVVSVTPVLKNFLEKFGIGVTMAKRKAFSSPIEDIISRYGDEEDEKEKDLRYEFHEDFINILMRRRHLDREAAENLATDKIFTGRRAKELGLVDEIGDFDHAVDLASKLGRVERRIAYVKPRRTFFQRVLSRFATSLVDEIVRELEQRLASGM